MCESGAECMKKRISELEIAAEFAKGRIAALESEVAACAEDEKELWACRDKCSVLERLLSEARDSQERLKADCADLAQKNRMLLLDKDELDEINTNLNVQVVTLREVIRDLAGK